MPPPRPRGFGNSSGISGRPSPSTPMSERQQMALLMQMTSASPSCSPDVHQPLTNLNQLASRSRDRNERGETSLHVAAIKGDQEGVKKLLDSGVSPNVLDFAGWSPLHEACSHGYYNIAFSLIKAGANVNAKGLDDDTPLHDAAVIGNLKLVKLLIEKGADIFAKNRKGKTPTDVAAASISAYMCSIKDVPLNNLNQLASRSRDRNERGETSLHIAAQESVKKLLESGVSPNVLDFADSNHNSNKSAQTSKKGVLSDLRRNSESEVSELDPYPPTSDNNEENNAVNFKKNFKDSLNIDDGKSQQRNKVDKPIQKDEFYNDDDTTNILKLGNFNPNTNNNTNKRAHSDIEVDETTDADELKKKKRKESESFKDNSKVILKTKAPTRNDKATKQTVVLSKPNSIALKINSERKSPCLSPKPTLMKAHDCDLETEDTKILESTAGNGPKVPPLKIVIPQQNDPECGSRNGKVNSVRNQIAHPYVVSSSNSNDSVSAEKDTNVSRCNSPTEVIQKNNSGSSISAMLQEEKNVKLNNEEKGQQRILRSSHRGHNIDRSSNNSSPQLQSNSPSPAAISEINEKNLNPTNNAISLQVQNQALDTDSNGLVANLSTISSPSLKDMPSNSVELHPRKRKIRTKHEENFVKGPSTNVLVEPNNAYDIHPHDHPFTNCYHMYLNIRNQIEKKHRTLFPIQPRPPQGFAEYLMNRRSYLIAKNQTPDFSPAPPPNLPAQMIDLFKSQEKERYKLKMKHVVEKEKLGLTVEQEILRVHGKAARSLACQSVPFSVCTFLKDEEVYNLITPEQEEKDRNARSRYNGRLFISWLQDVDDKWEKIKEAMVLRHHNEAESLHALQRMGWDEGLKDNDLYDNTSKPYIQEEHVPIVHVSDDFELLPA